MSNTAFSFPPMPAGADKKILKPSKSFNKQVYRSIGAIFLFLITYLILLLAAIAIAIAFVYLGIAIISGLTSFFGLVAGAAFIGAAFILFFFVIKFLFKSNPTDRSGMMEVTEEEQPQLFAFIRQLTTEAQAPFPKKIFISADVNAGVFYDSSFWSMFFPVKKNLKIGLGLVNAVNISEFKAVMAHEFGHFSQRSMKFGSYVYNLNKVIYNMLYDNEGYGKLINGFARIHNIFRAIAWVNIKIIEAMQFILRKIYVIVNKTYLALSREMEFHADATAAYVSGSNQMISSLKRIEIGQLCYSGLLNYWDRRFRDNQRSANFYPQQMEMIRHFAKQQNIQVDNAGLPIITADLQVNDTSQIVINNQWSSHPSKEDREAALKKINLDAPAVSQPAWLLFNNVDELQTQLTNDVYSTTKLNPDFSVINFDDFKTDFYKAVNENSFNALYKGYYDERSITAFDIDKAIKEAANVKPVFDELFTDAHCGLRKRIERMQQDMAILDTLAITQKDVKTFDYKGNKYKAEQADAVRELIDQERQEAVKQQETLDKNIFIYFYNACKTEPESEMLIAKYRKLLHYQTDAVKDYELYNNTMTVFNNVYNTMTVENINRTVNQVYKYERELKPRIETVIADEETRQHLVDEQVQALDKYLSSKWMYYYEPKYDNAAIAIFNAGVSAYISAVSKRNFEIKKDLLNFQAGLQ
ncbi:M48 family metallopeptidase [Mucilaginibacter flavus]|uniref:M48 family metallopeptidase n=1 Tax=Mucilaginibacter flavus TaxID=931504 RepID=UPI0025B4103D|nr:M48 family metallopeptidase [Mucilaginibacter flavus]MDN3584048.1 M48 family metallopeptidase [Mucilaginibacter flavus]